MDMGIGRTLIIATLFPAILLSSGCATLLAGAAAGAGTVAYVRGELKATKQATIHEVYSASVNALNQLEIEIERKDKDATSATIEGRLANNKDLKIWLERKSDSVTRLGIRIGTFGDEEKSRMILNQIENNLQ